MNVMIKTQAREVSVDRWAFIKFYIAKKVISIMRKKTMGWEKCAHKMLIPKIYKKFKIGK